MPPPTHIYRHIFFFCFFYIYRGVLQDIFLCLLRGQMLSKTKCILLDQGPVCCIDWEKWEKGSHSVGFSTDNFCEVAVSRRALTYSFEHSYMKKSSARVRPRAASPSKQVSEPWEGFRHITHREQRLGAAHVSGDTSSSVLFTPSWDRKWWGRPRQSWGVDRPFQEMVSASLISPVQI